MRSDQRLSTPGDIRARTTLGFHPRDGRPVACWVVHPASAEPEVLALLDGLARRVGLTSTRAASFPEIAVDRVWISCAGRHATLRTQEGPELTTANDADWLHALRHRGWAVIVVGYAPRLAEASDAALMAYLAGGGRARVGIVRTS
jgi:hypothetical protein